MPVKVFKSGSRWHVKDSAGSKLKKGRSHSSKAKADRQARAINASLRRSGKI